MNQLAIAMATTSANSDPESAHQTKAAAKQMRSLSSTVASIDHKPLVEDISLRYCQKKADDIGAILVLAFQAVGVVFGDIGTSPMYVFSSTFGADDKVPTPDQIIGVLSIIIYSLTLIPLIKYVVIVLRANDHGEGGTFAMYSLIHKHLGEDDHDDEKKNNFSSTKSWKRKFLLIVAMLGTCMIIGDGIFTPCISVLSAVNGVKKYHLSQGVVVAISVVILIVLFFIQMYGTNKIGNTFSPVIIIWYMFIAITGLLNVIQHDPTIILKAFNPAYIFRYFVQDPKEAWISLGGIVLSMTGAEAMYADLGHFSVRSIQIAFGIFVYPCLLCTYTGQAAYLTKYPHHVSDAFYKSTPERAYWPMLVLAVLASIIASQAIISGTFSIIKQAMDRRCFPRLRVVHTSRSHEGQVYIPLINWLLLTIVCILVLDVFGDTSKIGNAYGIAVVAVMLITTFLFAQIMILVWETNAIIVGIFVVIFGIVELVYLSSVLYKFTRGGYLPLLFAAFLFFIMYTWHYVESIAHIYDHDVHKIEVMTTSLDSDVDLSMITRGPGISIIYTETQGIIRHLFRTLPAILIDTQKYTLLVPNIG